MSDPWSSLQASDAPDSEGQEVGIHPAYANYNDQGKPQVGFDVFMELPKVCLKCANPGTTKRVADVNVKRDALTHLMHRGSLSQSSDKVVAGKYKLDLPHCEPCLDAFTTSRKTYILSFFLPFIALAAIVVAALIYSTAALLLFLVAVIAVPVAQGIARKRYNNKSVAIAALDTDGFIVLTGVDMQAGEAIVTASGA